MWIEWIVFDTLIDCFSFCFFDPKICNDIGLYCIYFSAPELLTHSKKLDMKRAVKENIFFFQTMTYYHRGIIKLYFRPKSRYHNVRTKNTKLFKVNSISQLSFKDIMSLVVTEMYAVNCFVIPFENESTTTLFNSVPHLLNENYIIENANWWLNDTKRKSWRYFILWRVETIVAPGIP